MTWTIGSLSGIFTGDTFLEGPLSVEIDNGHIHSIVKGSVTNPTIDGRRKILSLPFVDGHTHLIFGGNRFFELEMKLEGKPYADILAQGGGIQSTVTATRETSSHNLLERVLGVLDVMLAHGTTTVEAKSGYGLDVEHELRLLEILNQANDIHPMTVVPTFGAAHVVPTGKDRSEYITEIVDEMLPEVVRKGLATTTDVFCDRGAFTVEETRIIFDASLDRKLPVRVHAEELQYTGIAKIAASEYQALSADHLLLARGDDFVALAETETVAMFMPTAPISLFTDKLPSEYNQDGLIIGLGTDFNPNNWTVSMQTAIRHAVFRYGISPISALQAATQGSAKGVLGEQSPYLAAGSPASFVLLQGNTPAEFVSKFGQNLVSHVVLHGELVHHNSHHMF